MQNGPYIDSTKKKRVGSYLIYSFYFIPYLLLNNNLFQDIYLIIYIWVVYELLIYK